MSQDGTEPSWGHSGLRQGQVSPVCGEVHCRMMPMPLLGEAALEAGRDVLSAAGEGGSQPWWLWCQPAPGVPARKAVFTGGRLRCTRLASCPYHPGSGRARVRPAVRSPCPQHPKTWHPIPLSQHLGNFQNNPVILSPGQGFTSTAARS